MRDHKRKAQKKNYEKIPTPCPPIHTLLWINHPPPIPLLPSPHPTIVHNNTTMDKKFLIEIMQSNKYWSVRNDEILNLHLGSGAGCWISISTLLQDNSHIYLLSPPKKLTRKKKTGFHSQKMVSNCLGLHTQNLRLREVDFEPCPKIDSNKINMLK